MPVLESAEAETLERVKAAFLAIVREKKTSATEFFRQVVRQGLDEVLDGPRTGRFDLRKLSKTEATYVGTKMEILVRSECVLDEGVVTDLSVSGVDVDVKWSKSFAGWQIAEENVGQVCLGLCLSNDHKTFSVGLFVPYLSRLRPSKNKDAKKSLSKAGRSCVTWLVHEAELPPPFLAGLTEIELAYVLDGKRVQERVTRLFLTRPRTFIPRLAISTVAMRPHGDPMRRTRADRHNPAGTQGLKILSTKQKGSEIRRMLGLSENALLKRDHWIAFVGDE